MKLTQIPQIGGPGRPEGAAWELPSFKAPHRVRRGDEAISRAVLSPGLQNQLLILIFPCNSPPLSLPPSLSPFIKIIQKHESSSLPEVTSITAQLMPFQRGSSPTSWSGNCFSLNSMEISPVSTHGPLPTSHYHLHHALLYGCPMAAASKMSPLGSWTPADSDSEGVRRKTFTPLHPPPPALFHSKFFNWSNN